MAYDTSADKATVAYLDRISAVDYPADHTSGTQLPPPAPIRWRELRGEPPPREWLIDHWLGTGNITLMAGAGGVGKTLFAQQMCTWLALGRDVLDRVAGPARSLMWCCEDDHDELWRRQHRICHLARVGFDTLDPVVIVPRAGHENTMLSTEFGRPMWTPIIEDLAEQVMDIDPDVVVIDNVGQVFGANENCRHDVTVFVNGLHGVVNRGRHRACVLLSHPARATGSEYAGSGAWENAVRMRWWMAEKLPDDVKAGGTGADWEEGSDGAGDGDGTRFLCKRKTNYSAKDYVQLQWIDGAFGWNDLVDNIAPALRMKQAERVVTEAVAAFQRMQIAVSEARGRNYLPTMMIQYRLAENLPRAIIERAMVDMVVDGTLVKAEVGRDSARRPKMGLIVSASARQGR